MKVNRFLAALSALFVGINPAFSADTAAAFDEGFNWTGFYIGVYGAYGKGTSESDVAQDAHPSDPFPGIHAGYLPDFDRVI